MKWAAMAGRRDAGTAVRNAAWTIALLTALPTFRLSAQDAQRGRAVYEKWCLECHGEKGEGNGAGAKILLPPPRDFTRGVYKIRTTASGELPTDDDLERVVSEGMPGTGMPEWKTKLSDAERKDVVGYVKSLSSFFQGAKPQAVKVGSAP